MPAISSLYSAQTVTFVAHTLIVLLYKNLGIQMKLKELHSLMQVSSNIKSIAAVDVWVAASAVVAVGRHGDAAALLPRCCWRN